MSAPALPSIEAIEYGRRVLTAEVKRLRKFEANSFARGDIDASKRWGQIANWIDWQIVGEGEGCVIRPFDARRADPKFRAMYNEAFPANPEGGD